MKEEKMDDENQVLPGNIYNQAVKVYYAARDGMSYSLCALLNDNSPGRSGLHTKEEICNLLSQHVEDDGQKCTPLIIAARNGHDTVVRLLLSRFQPDLEQEATVKLEGNTIEGASALWCAAGAGHLKVVKTLVRAGADVNHSTKTKSTPLRAACFDGRLDIVKYLVEHKANVHLPNKYNNSCLMISAFRGHLEIVRYLLECGVDPNQKAKCGATALHFSAGCGHVEIVSELMTYGAEMTYNKHGMTPLLTAAERTREAVVRYLIQRPEVDKERRIEALELLGASFANSKDNYHPSLAYHYLKKGEDLCLARTSFCLHSRLPLGEGEYAHCLEGFECPRQALFLNFAVEFTSSEPYISAMEERLSDPGCIVEKPFIDPIVAYDFHQESRTLEELEQIQFDTDALHMESLVIRERILGPYNPELTDPIIYRGAVCADMAQFERCIALWAHALKLRQKIYSSVMKDLLRFAQVFSQMLHVGVELTSGHVLSVLSAGVDELERNHQRLHSLTSNAEDINEAMASDELESNMHTVLYLLVIAGQLKFPEGDERTQCPVRQIIYRLNRIPLKTRQGRSLLHLACCASTPVDDFHTNDVCRFPCDTTAQLLIECGADVNAMDADRNTPLHLIVGYLNAISDFMTLHNIILSLLSAGAHVDVVNVKGKTPFQAASTGVAEIILKTQMQLSLKCLAAKAVNNFHIAYHGTVPVDLEGFIQLHGPGMG
ncbi:unnamed protein product [Darwinula stevensoni]|uniref:Protein fem-1 homolog B n=1 Tax=Darwinula stevensoni TaxID=69355 RepID=A0A7R8XFB3_9CRUS|nr:unnamed protein product [Darwinula stevensoni]CAG0890426.1 unnamed protein product [Darwinula stevensoni]